MLAGGFATQAAVIARADAWMWMSGTSSFGYNGTISHAVCKASSANPPWTTSPRATLPVLRYVRRERLTWRRPSCRGSTEGHAESRRQPLDESVRGFVIQWAVGTADLPANHSSSSLVIFVGESTACNRLLQWEQEAASLRGATQGPPIPRMSTGDAIVLSLPCSSSELDAVEQSLAILQKLATQGLATMVWLVTGCTQIGGRRADG